MFVFAINSGHFRINNFLVFFTPLLLLNYFLFNLFLFLQKSAGGGGGAKAPTPSPSICAVPAVCLKLGNYSCIISIGNLSELCFIVTTCTCSSLLFSPSHSPFLGFSNPCLWQSEDVRNIFKNAKKLR